MATCKPTCDYDTRANSSPMPIRGRVRGIDACIARIVAALNAGGVETEASCCGHAKSFGHISLADGRQLVIVDGMEKALELIDHEAKRRNIKTALVGDS